MTVHDLTAKLTAAALDQQQSVDYEAVQSALLAAIVDSSDDAIVSKTLDGRILTWNKGAERLFGYSAGEIVGRPITTLIPSELHSEEQVILEKVRRGERVEHFETTRLTKDGRLIPISLSVSPVRNARGEIVAASKIARDISERRGLEQLQREKQEYLSSEADALSKLNEWGSRLWRCRSLAEGLDEMLGIVIELLGADKGNIQLMDEHRPVLRIAVQRGFAQEFLDFFREVSAEDDSACGRALREQQRIIIEDIEADVAFEPLRPVARAAGYRAVLSIPLIATDDTPLGMLSTHFRSIHRPTEHELRRLDLFTRQASDFIQRCRIEEALRKSEEALRTADRRKDEFLALLAHELRNPLAPIRYAITTNKKPGRTAEQQRRAEEVIERQVSHMSRLLDDLLDVSRITHGALDLKMTRTELTLIVGAAIDTARPILDKKHHTLELDLPKNAVKLQADPVRLAQVFSNLLINAAKYTDPGGHIQLRAAREDGQIVVAVRDDGIGIAPELMPRLFTLFTQAHPTLERSEGGLGVGLALARGLVKLHGGEIEVHSEGAGRGSEFVVRLPVGTLQTESRVGGISTSDVRDSVALRVLVVDDNVDAAEMCAIVLGLSGHDVKTAFNAAQAVELGQLFRPDVCLLDIGLPDVTGYELASRIRASEWGSDALLIAVTGWGQEEDKRRALEAGFDHHLTKPIAAEVIESLLQAQD